MNNFISADFWFNQRPGLLISFWKNSLIFAIFLFLILAILAFFLKKKGGLYSKLLEKSFTFFSSNFLIGLLLFFFNNELVPLLSARFWYLAWAIVSLIWLYFLIRYALSLPNKKKEIEKQREFEKYLPK